MSIRYYDDAVIEKIKRWLPENSKLRVLSPDDTNQLFRLTAEDKLDKKFTLPFIGLSRDNTIELQSTIKTNRSYDGLKITNNNKQYDSRGQLIIDSLDDTEKTLQLNAIPIRVAYQLDIYTKNFREADEYVRTFVFKLLNNPEIRIIIPYQNYEIENRAYIRLQPNVSDTSDIGERLYKGEFCRWTIQFEIQDAYFFNMPYHTNWQIVSVDLETSENIQENGDIEQIK